jgi:CheY-like chemotaxis protein
MPEQVVLNVEDDEASYFVLQKLFKEICPDAELKRATNGVEALESIQSLSENPDVHLRLVLLDINLPTISGWEVLQAIRAVESFANLPVVMFTALARESDRARCLGLGVEYFEKPSDVKRLVEMIREVCDKLGLFAGSLS